MLKGFFGIIKGMHVVLKHLFKKAVTLEYPEKRLEPSENLRGLPEVNGCVGCLTCTKVCPANAITVTKDENKKVIITFDIKKCIFCGNCAYYCPKNAIKMSKKYELANSDKNKLSVSYIQAEKE